MKYKSKNANVSIQEETLYLIYGRIASEWIDI